MKIKTNKKIFMFSPYLDAKTKRFIYLTDKFIIFNNKEEVEKICQEKKTSELNKTIYVIDGESYIPYTNKRVRKATDKFILEKLLPPHLTIIRDYLHKLILVGRMTTPIILISESASGSNAVMDVAFIDNIDNPKVLKKINGFTIADIRGFGRDNKLYFLYADYSKEALQKRVSLFFNPNLPIENIESEEYNFGLIT